MKNRGPAFPCTSDQFAMGFEGMSLRDWFAGLVLPSIVADNESRGISGSSLAEDAADRSYEYADAMLSERDRGES